VYCAVGTHVPWISCPCFRLQTKAIRLVWKYLQWNETGRMFKFLRVPYNEVLLLAMSLPSLSFSEFDLLACSNWERTSGIMNPLDTRQDSFKRKWPWRACTAQNGSILHAKYLRTWTYVSVTGRDDGKCKRATRHLIHYRFPSLPVPRLATNVSTCNGQLSSEISCGKCTYIIPHRDTQAYSHASSGRRSSGSRTVQPLQRAPA
jgi:hypothetical protein